MAAGGAPRAVSSSRISAGMSPSSRPAQVARHVDGDHAVGRRLPDRPRERADRGVGAVAGLSEHHEPSVGRHPGDGLGDGRHPGDVVGEVEHDRAAVEVEDVGAAGVVVRTAAEGRQRAGDGVGVDLEPAGRGDHPQRVGDVVPGRPAEGGGDAPRPRRWGSAGRSSARRSCRRRPPRRCRRGGRARGPPSGPGPGCTIRAGRPRGRAATSRSSSALRTRNPLRRTRLRDHQLGLREVVEVLDAVLAEVVLGDVGDDGHVGALERQPAPEQAAACHLEDRRLDAAGGAAASGRRRGRRSRRPRRPRRRRGSRRWR